MCCHTDQCCCGCTNQRTGIIIAGVIDAVMHLVFGILWIAAGVPFNLQLPLNPLWSIIVIIADVLLIIGANTRNSGCLITWMVIGMINIVFCFIAWIWVPIAILTWGWFNYLIGLWNHSNDNRQNVGGQFLMYAIFVLVIAIPIYYIYLWVVVKSFQSILSGTAHVVVPQQPIIRQANVVPQN